MDVILPPVMQGCNFCKATIEGIADFSNAVIRAVADFREVTFGSDANFNLVCIEGSAHFRGATVGRDAEFRAATIKHGLDFRAATIKGVAYFNEAVIGGNANFRKATMEQDCDFNRTTIHGNSYLEKVHTGWLSFENAEIGNTLRLDESMIHDVSFKHARLAAGLTVKGAEIARNMLLDHLTAGADCQLDGVEIGGTLFMRDAAIKGSAYLTSSRIGGAVMLDGTVIDGDLNLLRVQIDGSIRLRDASIAGDLNLQESDIARRARLDFGRLDGKLSCRDCEIGTTLTLPPVAVHIGPVNFDGCRARHLDLGDGRPRIRGWGHERCGIYLSQVNTSPSFWRFAQRTFASEGKRTEADAAFYFERIALWKNLRGMRPPENSSEARRVKAGLARAGYWFLFWLDCLFLRWMTAYGASLARLITTWFAVIGGFGIAFSAVPELIERGGAQVWTCSNWIIGFHYSATTFATLGLGHVGPGPSRLGMVLTSIEALLGAVLIALAVLVIGRRFMR